MSIHFPTDFSRLPNQLYIFLTKPIITCQIVSNNSIAHHCDRVFRLAYSSLWIGLFRMICLWIRRIYLLYIEDMKTFVFVLFDQKVDWTVWCSSLSLSAQDWRLRHGDDFALMTHKNVTGDKVLCPIYCSKHVFFVNLYKVEYSGYTFVRFSAFILVQ